jgi:hypothetical protein
VFDRIWILFILLAAFLADATVGSYQMIVYNSTSDWSIILGIVFIVGMLPVLYLEFIDQRVPRFGLIVIKQKSNSQSG